MVRQGVPMTPEERLEIINIYRKDEDTHIEVFERETGFSRTSIIRTIEDYKRGLIDARGYYTGTSMHVKNGKFKEMANPIEYFE